MVHPSTSSGQHWALNWKYLVVFFNKIELIEYVRIIFWWGCGPPHPPHQGTIEHWIPCWGNRMFFYCILLLQSQCAILRGVNLFTSDLTTPSGVLTQIDQKTPSEVNILCWMVLWHMTISPPSSTPSCNMVTYPPHPMLRWLPSASLRLQQLVVVQRGPEICRSSGPERSRDM